MWFFVIIKFLSFPVTSSGKWRFQRRGLFKRGVKIKAQSGRRFVCGLIGILLFLSLIRVSGEVASILLLRQRFGGE
jgi:hypothetical protein